MVATMNVVIGLALIRAARDPIAYEQTIDLCLAINAAHMGMMLLPGLLDSDHHTHLAGDVAMGIIATAVLALA